MAFPFPFSFVPLLDSAAPFCAFFDGEDLLLSEIAAGLSSKL